MVNADNVLVVNQAQQLNKNLCWYSTNEQNPLIQQHISQGKPAVFIRANALWYHNNAEFIQILSLQDIPMTMNGAAEHNTQNALGVVGLCMALAIPIDAIRNGLQDFGSSASDNPGRGNIYKINGATVIVDFAHNEHSMQAVVNTANQIGGNRKFAMFSHAGDRSDQEIQDLTQAVAGLDADVYIVSEVENYLRGRELGDIPQIVSKHLNSLGIKSEQIHTVSDPLEGAKLALKTIGLGDLVLLFVLADREQVHQYLSSQQT